MRRSNQRFKRKARRKECTTSQTKCSKEEGTMTWIQMLLMGQKLRTDHWINKMDIFGEFTKSV